MAMENLFRNVEEKVSFSAGDQIFEQGEPGDVMYGVAEGEVGIPGDDGHQPIGMPKSLEAMLAEIKALHLRLSMERLIEGLLVCVGAGQHKGGLGGWTKSEEAT